MEPKQTDDSKSTKKMVYRNLYIQVEAGKVYPFIPGTIVDIYVKKGQVVKAGDKLLLLYAMKMNNDICAPISGKIKSINIKKDQIVSKNDILVEIE